MQCPQILGIASYNKIKTADSRESAEKETFSFDINLLRKQLFRFQNKNLQRYHWLTLK